MVVKDQEGIHDGQNAVDGVLGVAEAQQVLGQALDPAFFQYAVLGEEAPELFQIVAVGMEGWFFEAPFRAVRNVGVDGVAGHDKEIHSAWACFRCILTRHSSTSLGPTLCCLICVPGGNVTHSPTCCI